jgi:hypothetical protein
MPAVDGGSETNLLGGWPRLGDGGEQINRLDFPVRRGGAPVVGVSVVEGHRGGAGQWAGSATVAGRRSVGWLWGARGGAGGKWWWGRAARRWEGGVVVVVGSEGRRGGGWLGCVDEFFSGRLIWILERRD